MHRRPDWALRTRWPGHPDKGAGIDPPGWAGRLDENVRALKLRRILVSSSRQKIAKIADQNGICAIDHHWRMIARNTQNKTSQHEQTRPLRPEHPQRIAARLAHFQPGPGRAHRPVTLALFAAGQATGGRRLHPPPGGPTGPQEARSEPDRLCADWHGSAHPGTLRGFRGRHPPMPGGARMQPGDGEWTRTIS